MCVPLYVICGCILVSLSLVGCLFAKFTLLSIKRRMISFVFTSKQSEIYFLRKFVSPSTLSCLYSEFQFLYMEFIVYAGRTCQLL